LPPPATETAKDHRLRQLRGDAWRTADNTTRYWRARLDWNDALGGAQRQHIGDANSFPACDDSGQGRQALLDNRRAALVQQMLTPAPNVYAVEWKRKQLSAAQFRYVDVSPERLRRAIDADAEWLAAHPSKKSKPMPDEAKEQRRCFEEGDAVAHPASWRLA
jgi:hypothetical protein